MVSRDEEMAFLLRPPIMYGLLQSSIVCYLLGTKFVVVVDHKPLLPLFNKVTRPKQARVDRHRMKLAAFDFEVVYEPGTSNPYDYGSRHPPAVTKEQDEAARQDQGEEDDTEVYVNR